MSKSLTIIAGAVAVSLLTAPPLTFARDEDSIRRGEQPTTKHGVQGSQDGGMAKTPTTAPEFVEHAAQDGMAEVALAQLALAKGQDADVKQFAQLMVDDHSKANQELTSLATAKGIKTPTDTDAKHKAAADRLSKLSGAAFDQAYIQGMVDDHDHAVTLFRGYAEGGDDPELKAWAAKKLPTLQNHERLAKTTATKIGVAERTSRTEAGK
jgi:putative membrane protein